MKVTIDCGKQFGYKPPSKKYFSIVPLTDPSFVTLPVEPNTDDEPWREHCGSSLILDGTQPAFVSLNKNVLKIDPSLIAVEDVGYDHRFNFLNKDKYGNAHKQELTIHVEGKRDRGEDYELVRSGAGTLTVGLLTLMTPLFAAIF